MKTKSEANVEKDASEHPLKQGVFAKIWSPLEHRWRNGKVSFNFEIIARANYQPPPLPPKPLLSSIFFCPPPPLVDFC